MGYESLSQWRRQDEDEVPTAPLDIGKVMSYIFILNGWYTLPRTQKYGLIKALLGENQW